MKNSQSFFSLSIFLSFFLCLATSTFVSDAFADTTVTVHDDESVTVHHHDSDDDEDDVDESETEEQCPAGFEESEDKCTPEERANGCRDMRLPGGLGCVDR